MPFRNDPGALFKDILSDIAKIEEFTANVEPGSFESDDQTAYAVKYALLRISEAAHRLEGRAAELAPNTPWRDIRGLGNRLRHAYDAIDSRLIWLIVEKDLPQLKSAVEAALCNLLETEERKAGGL